jgi:hypothetical protein
MKQKVLLVLNGIKSGLLKVYGICPFGFGIALGYYFRPELKIGFDLILGFVKGLLKL